MKSKQIDSTALHIKSGDKLPKRDISFGDKVNSGIINDIFYPMFVHAKKFYATEGCISCGKCVNARDYPVTFAQN